MLTTYLDMPLEETLWFLKLENKEKHESQYSTIRCIWKAGQSMRKQTQKVVQDWKTDV